MSLFRKYVITCPGCHCRQRVWNINWIHRRCWGCNQSYPLQEWEITEHWEEFTITILQKYLIRCNLQMEEREIKQNLIIGKFGVVECLSAELFRLQDLNIQKFITSKKKVEPPNQPMRQVNKLICDSKITAEEFIERLRPADAIVKHNYETTLHERVLDLASKYASKTGITPTKLYIGRKENKEILYVKTNNIEGMRPRYCGMYIFVVNDDVYLDCA